MSAKSDQLCNSQTNSVGKIFVENPMETSEKALVHKMEQQLQIAATSSSVPGRLRIADVDHDGFIDLIVTLVNSDLSTSTYLLENVANTTDSGAQRQLQLSTDLKEMIDVAGSTT